MAIVVNGKEKALAAVHRYMREHGIAPTLRDITEEGGFSSVSVARGYVKRLADDRLIVLYPETARGIVLTAEGWKEASGLSGDPDAVCPTCGGGSMKCDHRALFYPEKCDACGKRPAPAYSSARAPLAIDCEDPPCRMRLTLPPNTSLAGAQDMLRKAGFATDRNGVHRCETHHRLHVADRREAQS